MSTSPSPAAVPDFVKRSELLARAYAFARAAHEGSHSPRGTTIEHPTAVAALLIGEHADDEIVAAALLHEVIEDTHVTRDELEREFGATIADLVADLSEDPDIADFGERKAKLRAQVAHAGEDAAVIFMADKLASLQAIEKSGGSIGAAKLEHYCATLTLLSSAYPHLPFSGRVRRLLSTTPRA